MPYYVWYLLEPIIYDIFADHGPDIDTDFSIFCNVEYKALIDIATVNNMHGEILWKREEFDAQVSLAGLLLLP